MKTRNYCEQTLSIMEMDILNVLGEFSFVTQRDLADSTGYSLGGVNACLRNLFEKGYIDREFHLTSYGLELFKECKPKNAIILAAGFGMRMVPINFSVSKAFLEVQGERLIERLIRQLHEIGIYDITVVVGFMKESFEYLIDEFGVQLAVNNNYKEKNNLSSFAMVKEKVSDTYIVPCDLWCKKNPFRKHELYSWYMVSEEVESESEVRVNRKKELVQVPEKGTGNKMIGIAYLKKEDARKIKNKAEMLNNEVSNNHLFWETALYENKKMMIHAREIKEGEVYEINTYEQLRDLDADSNQLKSEAISTIAHALKCTTREIINITVLKKGMTNRSFLFSVKSKKYIMRIPGEGTDQLINRKQEAAVFQAIRGYGLCDDPVYLNADNGYKITKYLDGIRTCDPDNNDDLQRCMKKLRDFHSLRIQVDHSFDIYGQIEFYEKLWDGVLSVYRDYSKTKENVLSLKSYIDCAEKDWCLTHIDAVPDNFLFYTSGNDGEEQLQLTDWEYSGMQDPHVDIAMFCIYSLYDKQHCDQLIDIYFENKCDSATRTKIYCYIAACGLLWSNWCEYKRKLGVEFGEYSLRQYRYAKDFYKYAVSMMKEDADSEET